MTAEIFRVHPAVSATNYTTFHIKKCLFVNGCLCPLVIHHARCLHIVSMRQRGGLPLCRSRKLLPVSGCCAYPAACLAHFCRRCRSGIGGDTTQRKRAEVTARFAHIHSKEHLLYFYTGKMTSAKYSSAPINTSSDKF